MRETEGKEQGFLFICTDLDTGLAPCLLSLHGLVDEEAGADHGALGVPDQGIHIGVLVDRLLNVVEGLPPHLLVPVVALAAVLEHAHRVLGVDAVRHVAEAAEALKGVAAARVQEAVQRARAEVVLPAGGRLDLVRPLAVLKGRHATRLELVSQRS